MTEILLLGSDTGKGQALGKDMCILSIKNVTHKYVKGTSEISNQQTALNLILSPQIMYDLI